MVGLGQRLPFLIAVIVFMADVSLEQPLILGRGWGLCSVCREWRIAGSGCSVLGYIDPREVRGLCPTAQEAY